MVIVNDKYCFAKLVIAYSHDGSMHSGFQGKYVQILIKAWILKLKLMYWLANALFVKRQKVNPLGNK